MKKLFIVPHSHYDAEVFKTREEYLEWGYSIIIETLRMLKKYPDYRFVLDQVALIKPFLEKYVELREAFQEMVDNGRLEISCGMYIMPDVNIPSGESLIRQIFVGKDFCKKELGVDVKTGWMIDTFGHHPQMPQIMKKSGFEYYVFARVAKESTSEFYWVGIDGTSILTHWAPHHYIVFWNSPNYLKGFTEFSEKVYKGLEHYAATDTIMAMEGQDFNNPVEHTVEMVSEHNKNQDKRIELKIATPLEFFKDLEKQKDQLTHVCRDFNPVFQGCYSSRIDIKQWNRFLENYLYNAELFEALLLSQNPSINNLDLSKAWELVLFNQFHDVICGCHVDKVFDKVITRYKQAKYLIDCSIEENLKKLVQNIDTTGEGEPFVVFNTLSWERNDKVEVSVAFDDQNTFEIGIVDSNKKIIPSQIIKVDRYSNGSIKQASVLFIARVPSIGYDVFRVVKNPIVSPEKEQNNLNVVYGMTEINNGTIENEFLKLEVNLWTGAIKSIVSKEDNIEFVNPDQRELNVLVKEADMGDFWEINSPLKGGATYPVDRKFPLPQKGYGHLSTEYGGCSDITNGSIKKEYVFDQKLPSYTFQTRVLLYSGIPRIEIKSSLINNEENVRYRVAFPVNIKNGEVTYEIPFGAIQRPEGEFPAQNWIDYSDSQKGIGLINCGLPGNGVVDDTLFLSILKCTSFVSYGDVGGFDPSASSSMGMEKGVKHEYSYALVPHQGDYKDALMYRHGMELNHPLIVYKTKSRTGILESEKSFINIDKPNISISCLKKSDNGFIVRMYEAEGKASTDVTMGFGINVKEIIEVDLIQNEVVEAEKLIIDNNSVSFIMSKYQIKSFEVKV